MRDATLDPQGATPLLDLQDLRVIYHIHGERASAALNGVSFRLCEGEVAGVVGESGSGKTTLALAIAGLLPPNAALAGGSIVFQGREMARLSERELQKIRGAQIALVLQEPAAALNPVLRIGDHISEVLRAHERGDRRSRREAVHALLREVRLPDPERICDAYPHQLSGGERQRAAIAQALACRPALLIADEPTTALDATTQAQILELFRELRSRYGMAILMITHDPSALAGFADRMIVLHEGRIVEDSSFDKVCRHPRHPYTRSLLSLMRPSLKWRAQ